MDVIIKHLKIKRKTFVHWELTGKEPEETKVKKKIHNQKVGKRATYKKIEIPSKFLNPHEVYRFYMSNGLVIKDGMIVICNSTYNAFKMITSTTINRKTKMLQADITDCACYTPPPWQYLVERLRSLGDADMSDWAAILEMFCIAYEEWLKMPRTAVTTSSEMCTPKISEDLEMSSIDQFKQSLMKNECILTTKHDYVSESGEIVSFGYNENLCHLLGYETLEEMSSSLLKDGFSDVLQPTRNTMQGYKLYLKGFCSPTTPLPKREIKRNLVTRFEEIIPVTMQTFTFPINEGGMILGMETFVRIRVDPSQMQVEVKKSIDIALNTTLKKSDNSHKEELENFLEKYYDKKDF
jgi:hypothetical protein